ncbi:MAG: fructosamine kinase family protein [Paraglaciecola sp.]|uniref:fructosamine kinase family protein n=1 Tax=Paraglaciecola sp. TaxID=1920173 RepID=UPI00273EE9EF|nr:fructosamine kinase family protein [Paraglaciecola sp.]MDP5031025.1 fructosamine kinase family protein [Paraglaciecola sp.]MDP5131328.1 fructosamine kinase family protein [Paraglaciecola sp.]
MWHFISEEISKSINKDFICDDIREISSGHSHKAFKITDGRSRYFVKTNQKSYLPHFESEIDGLTHLSKAQLFRLPKIICSGVVADKAFLVLEFLTLSEGTTEDWFQFGQLLAQQHQTQTQNMYGWQEDNYIGLSPQPNKWNKKWCQFFAEQRIGFMLQLLAEKGKNLANIDKIVAAVFKLLAGHVPVASMLHGDFWSGNSGFHKGLPTLFDPALYYGDRETDIAMSELFARLPTAFYEGYQATWPLDPGYEYRKPVYQLYHVLNHALIFGEHYIQSAQAILKNMEQ